MNDPPSPGRPRPTALRVDFRSEPNNVPLDARPRFSWSIDDRSWGDGQSAYRIRLGRSPTVAEGDAAWDTGRVDSSRSIAVEYDGPPLSADETYHWTVKVWNDAGEASAFARPASFTTAPGGEWPGTWIAERPEAGVSNGYRSRWRDPDDDPAEWVQVDLGSARTIEAVELHPAEPLVGTATPDGRTITASDTESEYVDATTAQGPVAFGFPARYRIEVADDPSFADARTLVESGRSETDPRDGPVVHDVDSATARHVRVTATSLDEFGAPDGPLREEFRPRSVFALAALAVRDGEGGDAARDRPVTASSSVESEGWGHSRLTDGDYASTTGAESPLFRTEFELTKPVARARAHFAGLGYGELYLNGERAGEAVLDPGWTQYDRRVLYSTYDVTDALREGENAAGIWLGRGWFARSARHWQSFGSPRARLWLTVEYEDGTTTEVATDGEWLTAPSPIVENDVYDGETYDARLERPGWATPGFDARGSDGPGPDRNAEPPGGVDGTDVSRAGRETSTTGDGGDWEPAAVATAPEGTLFPQQVEPIAVTETLAPAEIIDREGGPIVDFGQNHAGRLSIDVTGGDPGDEVVLRHAEALDEDGGLRTVDLRSADATDTYVVGDGDATYEPRFTYHGYRYAQIEGYPGELTAEDVRSHVVHTGMPSTGEFDCSNEDLAAVQRNARWGLRSNAHSVPTDCPQRDERMGFTGDGHIAARALHYNFDATGLHRKWLRDHADAQSRHGYLPSKCPFGALPSLTDPTWTVSLLAVPWHLYRFYGDEGALERHYESMRRYVEFWIDVEEDGLLPAAYSRYGDWLALENADGRRGEPKTLFTNAYYYRSVDLLSRIAAAVGCEEDAERYRDRAGAVADAFNGRYFDPDRAAYESGTQAACALPLFFGLTPDDRAGDVAETLARKVAEEDDGSLRTGFLGTRPLLAALSEHGYEELAYRVASRSEFPGWVYMVRQGATTVWERWDSDSDEHVGGRMNSLNHSPFACVSEWFYERLAGIDVAFDADPYRVEIAPALVDDLSWAEGSVETPLGTVASRWAETPAGHEVTVDVPWNVAASVSLPLDGGDSTVRVDGEVVWRDGGAPATDGSDVADRERERVAIDVGAGTHTLRVE